MAQTACFKPCFRLKACSEVKEQLQDAEDRARRHREAGSAPPQGDPT